MSRRAAIVLFHKDHPLDPSGPNGGAETATIALARTLVTLGEQVYVAAELRNTDGEKELHVDGVCYLDLGPSFHTIGIFERFKNQPIHIIVACKAQALLESRAYSNILTRLFVTHEPSADGLGVRAAIIGEVADRVICVSESQKQLLVTAGCAAAKIAVIPNGVDLELFHPGDPQGRDYRRLLFAGALVVDKGLHLVIEAFAQLRQKYPDLTLDVFGTAALWGRDDYLDIEAIKRSVPGITFHGAVAPAVIAEAMRKAGLMVQPSIYFESFSLTTLEAQVTGLPAIGSSIGGMREIIVPDTTGMLVTSVSSSDLAQLLDSLLSQPERLREMSRRALELVRPKYSWKKTAAAFLTLLSEERMQSPAVESCRIGFLTTYNQQCGLATYAKYLRENLTLPTTILAERTAEEELTQSDDDEVVRCWARGEADYSELLYTVEQRGITALYLNCHYRFFVYPAFTQFLEKCRARNIAIVAHIHNPYTIDESLKALIAAVDVVVVHTVENRLEIIANGGDPAKTFVVEHGVKRNSFARVSSRTTLQLSADDKLVVCFGFVQAHKGIDEVLIAVAELRNRFPRVRLAIVGGAHHDDPNSVEYLEALKRYIQENKLQDAVQCIDGFVDDITVERYLAAADCIVMNYRSNYYEASGAVSLALGSGAPVICSIAPTFSRLGDAVFHLTGGFPMMKALEVVLTSTTIQTTLRENAARWTEQNSWEHVAQVLQGIVAAIPQRRATEQAALARSESTRSMKTSPSQRPLRVLMQNRPTALTHRGGDTVVMERLAAQLQGLNTQVDIDVSGTKDPVDYDLVHLYNFATPEVTEAQARLAQSRNRPYIVTTLYEDLPRFFHQMLSHYRALRAYVEGGQKIAQWPDLLRQAKQVSPCERWENTWTANHAAALLATGESERVALRRDYPNAAQIEICPLGSDLEKSDVATDLFAKTHGVSDYILCVGRLETRKNQLALLKALEDSELTLVFATAGFTYQPEYEAACRAFRRRGRTLFLSRLSTDELWSAYCGARVHALPSWYELPGMVSIEAARVNTPVVATEYGTTRDYLGPLAHYCDPGEPETIFNAVMAAYYGPRDGKLATHVENYTWEHSAESVRSIYERVMETSVKPRTAYSLPEWDTAHSQEALLAESLQGVSERASEATSKVAQIAHQATVLANSPERMRAIELCEEADKLVRAGRIAEATTIYQQAAGVAPDCGRAYRGLGVIALHSQSYEEAERYFRQALRFQANDAKALAGLGSCRWAGGEQEMAFEMYCEAFRYEPTQPAVLLHIINSGYALGRLTELEACLTGYLSQRPDDHRMRYCLAGCLYKQEKYDQAREQIARVLTSHPDHKESLELKTIMEEKAPIAAAVGVVKNYADPIDATLRQLEELKEQKKFAELAEAAERLLAQQSLSDDQHAHARVLRAEAWIMTGRADAADQELISISTGTAWASRAMSGRGVIAASREAWETARNLFDDALDKNPENDVALAGLGVVSMKLGKLLLAWDYFTRALRANGENMRALAGLIQVGYPLQRQRELEIALRTYLELHPANLSILYSYAGCLYSQKRVQEARLELEKIVLFDPNHGLAKELLTKIESEHQAQPTHG